MPYVPLTDSGPPDMTQRYNTPLTPAEELAYQNWAQIQSAVQGRDINRDLFDYDMRGAFKSGAMQSENGHYPDTFKKPNHPSFSDQSQYHGADGNAGGSWQQMGGRWVFTPGPTNLQLHGPEGLQNYFQRSDSNVWLNLPRAQPMSMLDYVNQQARPVQLAGDVVPFPGDQARPSINDIPPMPGFYPNSYNRSFGPGYDYRWHEILSPALSGPPANEANMLDYVRKRTT